MVIKMEEKDVPLRLPIIVVISIFVFLCLIWLKNQIQNEVLRELLDTGICLGVVWFVFLAWTIHGVVSHAINEKKNRIYQAQEPERLKQHQARFYCHICGKPSPGPYEYWDNYGENGQLYSSIHRMDYNKPTELVQCAKCQKWTCLYDFPRHLKNGVCKKCTKKTLEQVYWKQ